ncbi:MAG: sugar phosphate isomerase/epimerase [Patescibacteria group bacterium]
MNLISIMQGRLSPAENDRFQFFPTDWPAEFAQAKELGFDGLCWFLDVDKPNFDPIRDIWFDQEVLTMVDQAIRTLPVRGVDCGLVGLSKLKTLLPVLAHRLVDGVICIPLLEVRAPKSDAEWTKTADDLRQLSGIARLANLRIALETELPADQLMSFLDGLRLDNLGVCYDIGNATSYGFDCPTEIRTLGARIFDVHLKDRKVGESRSQLLGTGDADFKGCFEAFKAIDYRGGFTLQAWHGEDYLQDATNQLAFVKKILKQIYGH